MPHQQFTAKQVKETIPKKCFHVSVSSKFFHPSVKICLPCVAQPLWAAFPFKQFSARHRQSTSGIRASAGQLAFPPAHQSLIGSMMKATGFIAA